jgi:hypothetical protein
MVAVERQHNSTTAAAWGVSIGRSKHHKPMTYMDGARGTHLHGAAEGAVHCGSNDHHLPLAAWPDGVSQQSTERKECNNRSAGTGPALQASKGGHGHTRRFGLQGARSLDCLHVCCCVACLLMPKVLLV